MLARIPFGLTTGPIEGAEILVAGCRKETVASEMRSNVLKYRDTLIRRDECAYLAAYFCPQYLALYHCDVVGWRPYKVIAHWIPSTSSIVSQKFLN